MLKNDSPNGLYYLTRDDDGYFWFGKDGKTEGWAHLESLLAEEGLRAPASWRTHTGARAFAKRRGLKGAKLKLA